MRKAPLLALLCSLAACGGAAPAGAPGEPSALAALVPADAHVVLRLRSLDDAEQALTAIGSHLAAPEMVSSLADRICLFAGVDPARVDRARPLAIAAGLSKGAMPKLTFVLPVHDAEQVLAAHTGGGKAARGGYVALSTAPAPAQGGSPLAADLPDGDLAVRFDVKGLLALYRYEFDQGLGMAAGRMPGFDASDIAAGIRKVLDQARTLDLVADLDGPRLAVDLALAMEGGGGGGGRLGDLAGLLPRDFPFVVLLNLDFQSLTDLLGPAVLARVAEDAEPVRRELERLREFVGLFGEEWLVAYDFDAKGMRGVFAVRAPDPDAALLRYVEYVGADTTGKISVEGRREVRGTTVHRVRVRGDARLGAEGLALDVAATDGRLVCVAGGDAFTDQVLASGRAPATLSDALAGVRGDLRFLMRLELRGLLRASAALSGSGAFVPDGAPVPLVAWGSRDGATWRAGLRLDLPATAALVKAAR